MSKNKITEGLIDRLFGALYKGLEKTRKKATRKAMKDPKVQRKFKEIKKNIDDIATRVEKLDRENPDW
jgi:hypothetical protein